MKYSAQKHSISEAEVPTRYEEIWEEEKSATSAEGEGNPVDEPEKRPQRNFFWEAFRPSAAQADYYLLDHVAHRATGTASTTSGKNNDSSFFPASSNSPVQHRAGSTNSDHLNMAERLQAQRSSKLNLVSQHVSTTANKAPVVANKDSEAWSPRCAKQSKAMWRETETGGGAAVGGGKREVRK